MRKTNIFFSHFEGTRGEKNPNISHPRALCSTPKNVPDEILSQIPQNGGIVMMNFYNWFLNCDNADCVSFTDCPATVYDIVNHINHARKIAGVDHIGIGSDFCGIEL